MYLKTFLILIFLKALVDTYAVGAIFFIMHIKKREKK